MVPIVEPPAPQAVSPDSLASLLTIALADADSTALEQLLADDFRWGLYSQTVAAFDLQTNYLNRAEATQAMGRLFTGQTVPDNVLGANLLGIESIDVVSFVKVEDWETAGEFSVYPGAQTALFQVVASLTTVGGGSVIDIQQELALYVVERTVTIDGELTPMWRLARAEDSLPEGAKAALPAWLLGVVLCAHLEVQSPEAVLAVTDGASFPHASFVCDASGSKDDFHGLAPLPYVYGQVGTEPWDSGSQEDAVYTREGVPVGENAVYVTVRNRWGMESTAWADVVTTCTAPFAASREILMSNFKLSYENMLTNPLLDQLDSRFQFILLPETQAEWSWSSDFHFDAEDMVDIFGNLFGGEPGMDANGNAIHPIGHISFDLMEQQAAWENVPEDDPYFGGYGAMAAPFRVTISHYDAAVSHRFLVQQMVYFYAVTADEGGATVYRLIGIRGLPAVAKTDEVTWDAVLALYR